jgi:plastocyanin
MCCAAIAGMNLSAQTGTVTGKVEAIPQAGKSKRTSSPTVVWLMSLGQNGEELPGDPGHSAQPPRLVQKNKSFTPHLLVVPVGTGVEFPNHDPFFHNVFSLFDGKRFDLGLYEAGSQRVVHFDRPGISYVFCNIHPEMSAVVIALNTKRYAISDASGQIRIADVPLGRYRMHVWNEHALPEALAELTRNVTVAGDAASLGTLRIAENVDATEAHKNKYGRDYDPADPTNPVYPQP